MAPLSVLSPSSPSSPTILHRRNTTTNRQLSSLPLTRSPSLLTVRSIHAFLLRHPDLATCRSLTSLVSLYSKSGSLSAARHLFDAMPHRDVVTWTAILAAYATRDGQAEETMRLFHEMLHSGASPNRHTVTVVLRQASTDQGMQLHSYVVKSGWDSDEFIGSSFIELYAKSQNPRDAQKVFDRIKNKDVVCFNALSSTYGRTGYLDGLVSAFTEMGSADLVPNESTFVALLNGCARSGFVGPSKQFHAQAIVRGFLCSEVIGGVLVDMYAKCGDLEAARGVFDRMGSGKGVVAWNSVVGGYAKHGLAEEALRMFDSMELSSVKPDRITFTLLLSACSHSGLVDEGLRLFDLMVDVYEIPARNEHYCCVVDLLGRAGLVEAAYGFMKTSGWYEFGASVWSALLASCKVSGDVEIAGSAARRLLELEPGCSGSYVALSATLAGRGLWKEAREVRELMESNGVKKDAGCSWIEVGSVVRKFKAGEGEGEGEGVECDCVDVHSICDSLNSSIADCPQDELLIAPDPESHNISSIIDRDLRVTWD